MYFDDAHKLGLPRFLAQGNNAHVKAHMLAIFMVAAEKGYWKTDPATIRKMGGELARLVAANGLPGSGHTKPDHPMWQWLAPQLGEAEAQALGVTLARARGEMLPMAGLPAAPSALVPAGAPATAPSAEQGAAPRAYELTEQAPPQQAAVVHVIDMLAALAAGIALFGLGLWRGSVGVKSVGRFRASEAAMPASPPAQEAPGCTHGGSIPPNRPTHLAERQSELPLPD